MVVRVHVANRVETDFTPPRREVWMDKAACLTKDPEKFFRDDEYTQADALEACNKCEVVNDCLLWALMTEPPTKQRYGILGGQTAAGRKNIYEAMEKQYNEQSER